MSRFPDNKKFAFTIFDDTDLSTVENVQPVYSLLEELGMRTTKSVWPLASVAGARYGGSSLQDPEYLHFVRMLRDRGFEIALHNARNTHAKRDEVRLGIAEFTRLLGHRPRLHTNHSSNAENIYWGAARLHLLKPLYQLVSRFRSYWQFDGHDSRSPYFWGDICRDTISYVRNFVFREINLDRVNPSMPYHDPGRPFVNAWFSGCDGADAARFCRLLSEANQDKLEREGGVCIVYTHFACGFVERGRVHPRAAALLRRLAGKPGWFVPVGEVLDRLASQRKTLNIPRTELWRMECRWAIESVAGAFARPANRWIAEELPSPELNRASA